MAFQDQHRHEKIPEPPFIREVELIHSDPESRNLTFPPFVRFRGQRGPIRADMSSNDYLQARFATPELDYLRDKNLWLAGLPGHIRPLHRIDAQNLKIVVTEEARMHMIWSAHRVHLMPLDRVLIDYSRFRACFCEPGEFRPELYGAALGVLLSYVQLVAFESDLRIAQRSGLLPGGLGIEQWTEFTSAVMRTAEEQNLRGMLPPRWDFGLLRLGRVNTVYRLNHWRSPAKAIHGYYTDSLGYNDFLERNFRWFFVFFAYASIVLNALQAGLGTIHGQGNDLFNRFGWAATITVMTALAVGIAFVFVLLLVVVLENTWFALAMLSKRTMSP